MMLGEKLIENDLPESVFVRMRSRGMSWIEIKKELHI